ncbi:MAG: heavy-metal-associated domain-containing protein [Gemmataceae bacterium]
MKTETTTMTAEGVTCGGCATALKRAVAAVPGVQSVEVEVSTKRLTVTHAETVARAAVEAAVRKAGFTPA